MLDPPSMKFAMTVRKSWYRAYASDHALPQIMQDMVQHKANERLRRAIHFTPAGQLASTNNPNRRANKRRKLTKDQTQKKTKIQKTVAHMQQSRTSIKPRSIRI